MALLPIESEWTTMSFNGSSNGFKLVKEENGRREKNWNWPSSILETTHYNSKSFPAGMCCIFFLLSLTRVLYVLHQKETQLRRGEADDMTSFSTTQKHITRWHSFTTSWTGSRVLFNIVCPKFHAVLQLLLSLSRYNTWHLTTSFLNYFFFFSFFHLKSILYLANVNEIFGKQPNNLNTNWEWNWT